MQPDGTWALSTERVPDGEVRILVCDSDGCGIHVDPATPGGDPPCPFADWWGFDQPDFNGNMLCAYTMRDPSLFGILDLTQVAHPPLCIAIPGPLPQTECFGESWADAIQSWSAGTQASTLASNSGTPEAQSEDFCQWAYEALADTIAQNADELVLYNRPQVTTNEKCQ
jgi:hypothetical protein